MWRAMRPLVVTGSITPFRVKQKANFVVTREGFVMSKTLTKGKQEV
jgi:hypothetical protein